MSRKHSSGRVRGVLFGGRGQEPDGRPLTGFARFWEILDSNLSRLFLSNTPAQGAATLYGFALWIGMSGRSILLTLAMGLLCGALLGPCLCGSMDAILRILRREPGFWWETYKKAWRHNAAQAAFCGAIFGLILGGQIFSLWYRIRVGLTLFSMAVLLCVFLYVFPQIPLMKLRTLDLFRNALALALLNPVVTLRTLLIAAAWAFFLWLLWPLSILAWAAFGVWFPGLLMLLSQFGLLKKTFLERQEQ